MGKGFQKVWTVPQSYCPISRAMTAPLPASTRCSPQTGLHLLRQVDPLDQKSVPSETDANLPGSDTH